MGYQKKYLPLLLSIAIVAGVFLGSKLNFNDTTEKIFATNSKKDKLNRLIDYIDYEYVDSVNTDSIVDVTVNGILENLDPHSVYIPVDQYEDNADEMRGKFVGIGISFYPYNDSIAVIKTIEDGPAAKAGIKGGDRILYADGKPMFGKDFPQDSITAYLKGEKNSKIVLKIKREGEDKLLDITVKRNEVPLISVDATYKLTNDIGYIKLNRFSETSYNEFKEALDELLDAGATKIVLDLRGNPGGYIDVAEKIADEFLSKDKLILLTRNKNGDEEQTVSTKKGNFETGKLYVLIDENSASASEIVAGALQDNDRGTILGRRSFGKGLVQREMSLGDGSAVRLTIARYYTPTGRSIQRPYGYGNAAYYGDYENRYRNGELLSQDSIQVADSLKFKTPGGRIVYGGGGISPDIFIPKDTSIENETLQYVSRSNFLSFFIFEYLEKNRSQFEAMSLSSFYTDYNVPQDLSEEFISYAKFSNAQIDLMEYKTDLDQIIKANIAQQIYGPNAFEFILNKNDPMLNKIIELETPKVKE
jgi:carboxyl-terminal processing protease